MVTDFHQSLVDASITGELLSFQAGLSSRYKKTTVKNGMLVIDDDILTALKGFRMNIHSLNFNEVQYGYKSTTFFSVMFKNVNVASIYFFGRHDEAGENIRRFDLDVDLNNRCLRSPKLVSITRRIVMQNGELEIKWFDNKCRIFRIESWSPAGWPLKKPLDTKRVLVRDIAGDHRIFETVCSKITKVQAWL